MDTPAKESLGFPQLDISTYAGQVFWLFVAFVILYALMSKLALPRLGRVIDGRAKDREDNLSAAEKVSADAEKLRRTFEASLAEAQRSAQDLMREAERDITEMIAEGQAKFAENARKKMLSTEQTIQKAKNDAFASIADVSADLVTGMAEKIAGIDMTKADAKKIVSTIGGKV